jgi:hypothetical protein
MSWLVWIVVCLIVTGLVCLAVVLSTRQNSTNDAKTLQTTTTTRIEPPTINNNQKREVSDRVDVDIDRTTHIVVDVNVAWRKHIRHVYYINLDRRTDRFREIEHELLDRIGFDPAIVTRIPGVLAEFGHLGCSRAHIAALERAMEHNNDNDDDDAFVLIMEDDWTLTCTLDSLDKQLNAAVSYRGTSSGEKKPDVLMWAGNTTIKIQQVMTADWVRSQRTSTASGYMVRCSYIETLLKHMREGERLLSTCDRNHIRGEWCVDQYWFSLQDRDEWWISDPKLGRQRVGYSDNQGGVLDQGC